MKQQTQQQDIWEDVCALMPLDKDFTLPDVVFRRRHRLPQYSSYQIGAALKWVLSTGTKDLVRVRRGTYRLPSVQS